MDYNSVPAPKYVASPFKLDFPEAPEILGLSPVEAKIHQEAINALGSSLLQKYAPVTHPEFLSIHKEIKQLQNIADLPEATGSLLNKINSLAEQFELLILQAETEGINSGTVAESLRLQEQFTELRNQTNRSALEGLSKPQAMRIQEEVDGTLSKITRAAHWIDFKKGMGSLEENITGSIQQISLYHTFESNCGLSAISPSRGLSSFHALMQSLAEMTRIYDETYLRNKQEVRPDLNLAKIELLQASLERIAVALREHRPALNALIENTLNSATGNSGTDRQALKEVQDFVNKERPAIEQTLRRLSTFNLPERGGNLQSTRDEIAPPNTWLTGIFQMLYHPMESLQKAFDAIEMMSPLPSYSAPVLIAGKERDIEHDFGLLYPLLEDHLAKLEEFSQRVAERVAELPPSGKDQIAGIEKSIARDYQEWLEDFSMALQEGQKTIASLEAVTLPSGNEIDRANSALQALETKRESLNSMENTLIEQGFSKEVLNRLYAVMDKAAAETRNLVQLLHFRTQVNSLSDECNELIVSSSDRSLELARGGKVFSVEEDAALLESLRAFERLYEKCSGSGLPAAYENEIFKKIVEEISFIAFTRSEYSIDYHQGVEAEVARIVLLPPESEEAGSARQTLLKQLQATEQKYLQYYSEASLAVFQERLSSLPSSAENRASVLKELNTAYQQLNEDMLFIREQCAILEGKKEISARKALWIVRSHEKAVGHTVRVLDEGLEKQEGWSNTLMRFWVYSLYHHERISATAQFASQVYQSWNTGESPLKAYADTLSEAEFAKKVDELPEEEQARTAVELKLIEGILNGYMEYPPDLKKTHPATALFLLKKFNISPPADLRSLESEKGSSDRINAQGGPDRRNLSAKERNEMAVQYIGARVRGHYKKSQRQLESPLLKAADADWTVRLHHTPDTTQVAPKESKAQAPQELFGQQLAAAIKENQRGVSLDQNTPLIELQKGVEEVYGTSLPTKWIEERLFKQEWSEDRLAHFAGWLSESIGAQASYYLAQQRMAQNESTGTLKTPPPLLAASIGQQEVASAIHSVVPLLPSQNKEDLHLLQTSAASRVSSPLASVFKTVRAIRTSVVDAIWGTDRPGTEKMKTTLDPIYREVLSQLEGNRSLLQLQALVNSPAQIIDDRLFQHILGEYFGKKTGLEGHSPPYVLDYLMELTSSKIKALKENPLCDEKSRLDFCRTLLERGEEELPIQLFSAMAAQMQQAQELGDAFAGDIGGFYDDFSKKVEALKPEESFFFSGGWAAPGGGHHVVYEVMKQEGGLLTFRIYNRGEGAELHTNALVQEKGLVLPFTELVDIHSNRMVSIPFLQGLQNLNHLSTTIGKRWEAEDLYLGLLPVLGGKNSHRVYSQDLLMEGQLVGHCAYMSFTPWMAQQLGDQPTYSRWQFEVELKTLTDYFKQQQHQLPFQEAARHLFREGLAQFGRNVDRAYQNGLITDDEMKWIQELVTGMGNAAVQAESIYQASVIANAPHVAIAPVTGTLSAEVDNTDVFEDLSVYRTTSPPPYFSVDTQDWIYTPQNFSKDLNVFLDDIRVARKAGHDLNIKEGVQTFIGKVPLTGDVFWKQMTAEQGKAVLGELAALSRHYLFSLLILRDDNPLRMALDLENYLVQAKILTLADAANRHFKNEFGFEIPFLAQNELLDILEGRSLFSNAIHGEWGDQLRQMRQYWSQVAAVEPRNPRQMSFFGFEEQHSTIARGWDLVDNQKEPRGVWEILKDSEDSRLKKEREVWGANFVWPDVEFAKKWMERPEVAKQFAEDFPEYKNASPSFKAFIALGNKVFFKDSKSDDSSKTELKYPHPSTLLPSQFYDLRDIAYSTAFLLQGPNIKRIQAGKLLRNRDVEPTITLETTRGEVYAEYQDRPYWSMDYAPFGIKSGDMEYYKSGLLTRIHPLPQYIDPSSILKITQAYPRQDFLPFIAGAKLIPFIKHDIKENKLTVRMRLSPHLRNIIETRNEGKGLPDIDSRVIKSAMSWADVQQRLRLSSVDELQVSETLALYYKEPHLLTLDEEKDLFHYLINEKGLFIAELLRSPDLAAEKTGQLAKFIRNQYLMYEKLGDVAMQLYFLELSGQFQSLVHHTLQHYPGSLPEDYKISFLDSRVKLKAIIENEATSENDRSVAAYLMVKTFRPEDELSIDEAVELLRSGIRISQYPPLDEDKIKHKWGAGNHIESWDMLRKMRGPLERALQGEGKNRILNGLLKTYDAGFPGMQWEIDGNFPRFIANDGFTTVDVLKGNFFLKKKMKGTTLKEHFKSIIDSKGARLADAQVGLNKYEFKDSEGNDYRIVTEESRIIVQCRFKGNWYQLLDDGRMAGSIPYAPILDGSYFWLSINGDELFGKDIETDQFKYRLEIEKDPEGKSSLTTVHRTNAEGVDTAEVLVDIYSKPSPYQFLENIENKAHIGVWEDKDSHEPTRIELPRYKLDFEIISVGEERRAYCKQLPGYFLAPNQHAKMMGDVTTYLVMQKEHEKGNLQQIVWMPCEQMESLDNPLESTTKLTTETKRSVVHDIDPISQRLKPRNEEGRLHLAMVYLWERNYAEAIKYLRGYGTQIAPFSEDEKKVIGWIQEIENLNKDNTPLAKAVNMYSHFLKIRNQLDFDKKLFDPEKDEDYLKALNEDYVKYLQLRGQIGHSQLRPEEELLILQTLPKISSLLVGYRWQALSPWKFVNGFPLEAFSLAQNDFLNALEGSGVQNIIGSEDHFIDRQIVEAKKKLGLESEKDSEKRIKKENKRKRELEVLSDPDLVFEKPKDAPEFPLMNTLSIAFRSTYEQLKAKKYSEVLPAMMKNLSGMASSQDLPIDLLREQVLQMLWLVRNSERDIKEKVAAAMLGMALEYPESSLELKDIYPKELQETSFLKYFIKSYRRQPLSNINFGVKTREFLTNLIGSAFTYENEAARLSAFQQAVINWRPSFVNPGSKIVEDVVNTIAGVASMLTGNVVQQDKIFALDAEGLNRPVDSQTPPGFKTSLWQKELGLFPKPVVEDLNRYVTRHKLSPEMHQQAQSTSSALQKVFDVATADPVADRAFTELKKQIKDYGDTQAGVKDRYEIKDLQTLHDLKVELQKGIGVLSARLIYQLEGIVILANRPFADPLEEAKKQAKITGGLETTLGFNELLQLFRMRDREKFHARNPALSVQEVDRLNLMIRDFLITAVASQQQGRVIDKIDEIEKGIAAKVSEKELDGLVAEFAALATAVRQYEIHEHPEYLLLEYQEEILIRGSQAVNQERIAGSRPRSGTDQINGAALEAIPGSGKTAVHLTLQALNDADGEHLPLVVMPESLMPQMSKELQERLGDAYEQSIEMMSFDRNDIFDVPHLERIKYRLEAIIKDQKALLMTDSSVQGLVLKFVEKIVTFLPRIQLEVGSSWLSKITDRNQWKEISLFREIFTILRTSGVVTIDEIHLILDVLKAHHFTLGEALPMKEEVVTATTDFYLLLATLPAVQEKIRFGFLPDKGGAPFDPEYYRNEVQPLLVQAILDGEVGKNDKEIHAFFQSLDPKQKELVKAYLNNHNDKDASTFVDKLPSMKIKNTLAVLKEEVSALLPLTGKKQLDEHYGALPADSKVKRKDTLLAIPYHGSNNPVVNAQFGTDLEIIHYTIQMHLGKGISAEIVRQEIEQLKAHIRSEITRGVIKKIEDSPSYLSYAKLCGKLVPPPPFNLNENDIAAITKAVNENVEIQMGLIRRYVLPQLKSYARQLHTNGQIYAAIFHWVRGFSGTLWNVDAFPKIFYEIFLSDTMAKTLNILWENSPQKVETVHFPKLDGNASFQEKAKAIVESVYAHRKGFKGSFADASGLFREIGNNEDVARAMLAYQKQPIEGVSYYNNEEKLYVLVKGQDAGVPIDQCGLAKEQIVAYWDQKHTFGADVKLGGLMEATVSVGQFTMIFDLIQAVWRLRQLDKGQRVDFIVGAEDDKIIRDALKRITHQEIEGDLELRHLLLYTMYNQAMRQGDDNHRSLKQKMQILLIGKVFELVADPSIGDADFVDIIDKTKELFISETSQNPYEQYGRQEEYGERDIVLEQELEQFLNSAAMKAFAENPVLSKRYSIKEIESELRMLVDGERSKLPSQLKAATLYETETSVQLEAETKTETKTETQTETQTQRRVELYGDEGTYGQPFPEIAWNKETLFKKELYSPSLYAKLSQTAAPYFQGAADIVGEGVSPIVRFKDVIDNEKMTHEYADLIDPDLTATINAMPVYHRGYFFSKIPLFRPFGRFHDSAFYAILVEDKVTGARQFILADQVDAKHYKKILDEERGNPFKGERDVRVCLYHLELGVEAKGSDPIDMSSFESDPGMIKMKTQAKFLAGYLTYSESEKKAIHEWIESKGAEKLYQFFYNIVLNNNPTQQKAFPGSELANIFVHHGVVLQ